MFRKSLYKYEVADLLDISCNTLAIMLNKRYYEELKKADYHKNQKKLTPKQLNFLRNKIDLQPG